MTCLNEWQILQTLVIILNYIIETTSVATNHLLREKKDSLYKVEIQEIPNFCIVQIK